MSLWLANGCYLIASTLFILGLKGLTHPRTAVRGNLLSALGMLVAVATALVSEAGLHWSYILAGVLLGGLIGVWLALAIRMTAMPQLVALFNGLGGGASLLVAALALQPQPPAASAALSLQANVAGAASAIIGTITLTGSLVAFAKLQRLLRRSLIFRGQKVANTVCALLLLAAAAMSVISPQTPWVLWTVVGLAVLLGLLLVLPIGGADMPVIIAALNSYSGVAACGAGFILDNTVLIVSGSLVGASGMILTRIMCRAMNRSFRNVIFGLPMGRSSLPGQEDIYEGKVKSTSADEIAMLLEAARRVVIVPGYGMAVSQAQHAVRDLSNLLEARAVDVLFAIHPVAGRMPGHMNVLLAEADIPYDRLKEMEVINPTFDQTDVAIVIGANDVVNPQARNGTDSPIAGMPILDVDRSKTVVVIKRSLSPGFAGIANPLFAADNTLMLFEDAKKGVQAINTALKDSQ
jgi:NAD(P) transhydrogenase subunit beta